MLQCSIIVGGSMQPPHTSTHKSRHTFRDTGVGAALAPVPADQTPGLASGGLVLPPPSCRSVLLHANSNMVVRSMFI